jgi:hypothetical protein
MMLGGEIPNTEVKCPRKTLMLLIPNLPANNLSSFPFDLRFRKELFNNATPIETKQMSV